MRIDVDRIKIEPDELRRQIEYDYKTGIFTWRINKRGHVKAGDIVTCTDNSGYLLIGINGKRYRGHRLAWLYHYGYFPENNIDHINGIRTDNRISNLREVSQVCNLRNTGNPKDNKSGVKGVFFDKARNRWAARIVNNGKDCYLTRSNSFCEAVCHRYAAEQCLDWASCGYSTPAKKYLVKCGVLKK